MLLTRQFGLQYAVTERNTTSWRQRNKDEELYVLMRYDNNYQGEGGKVKCFNCSELGHIKQEYPKLKKNDCGKSQIAGNNWRTKKSPGENGVHHRKLADGTPLNHLALPSRDRGGVMDSGECTHLYPFLRSTFNIFIAGIGSDPVPQSTDPTHVVTLNVRLIMSAFAFQFSALSLSWTLSRLSSLFSGTRAHPPDNHHCCATHYETLYLHL